MQNQYDYARRDGADVSTKLTYLLIGGGIGAILALLFAPKSGQELRGDIADVTRKGIDRTREAATQIGARAEQYYEVGRDRAAELYSTATEKASELADAARDAARSKTGQVSAAIEAGRQAYVDEKRKTESSAITGTGPNYKAEKQG